jgi:hypothetical protein
MPPPWIKWMAALALVVLAVLMLAVLAVGAAAGRAVAEARRRCYRSGRPEGEAPRANDDDSGWVTVGERRC